MPRPVTKPRTKPGILDREKLVYIIMDALPFDFERRNSHPDRKKLRRIVNTVVDMLIEGILKDGFVTIQGFGRFYLKKGCIPNGYGIWKQVKFRPCNSLRRALDD